MDMWRPYRSAVRTALPDAKIVIDKFHVVKLANNALETVRKSIRESITKRQRLTLKNDRFLLLKRNSRLSPREVMLLDTWIRNFPILGHAYSLKEGFFAIWDCNSSGEAQDAFLTWKDHIPAELEDTFNPIVNSVYNWYEEIFAYFNYPITNAYTEAINGLIKIMNRSGRATLLMSSELKSCSLRSSSRKHRCPSTPCHHNPGMSLLT